MESNERKKIIWELRQSGKTFREIAEFYGFSNARARQLFISYKDRVDSLSNNILIRELQKIDSPQLTRTLNCLRNYFGDIETIDPHNVASKGFKGLLRIKNFGKKCGYDVALALENTGVIKDAKEWYNKK